MQKLVAVESGEDWADASVDYLSMPTEVDLVQAHAAWRRWYEDIYCPANTTWLRSGRPVGGKPDYVGFPQWLVQHCGATRNPDGIEVFHGD